MTPIFGSTISILIVAFLSLSGASFIFFLKKKLSDKLFSILLALSAGLMCGIAIFCLFRESFESFIEQYENKSLFFVSTGLMILGFLLMIVFDKCVERFSRNSKSNNLVFAIALHNIPEGLSFGVIVGELFLVGTSNMLHSAIFIAVGLGIHNFVQSLTSSFIFLEDTGSKKKSFLYLLSTCILEIIFVIFGALLSNNVGSFIPYLSGIAAGVMLFVSLFDMLKDSLEYKYVKLTTLFFILAFVLTAFSEFFIG